MNAREPKSRGKDPVMTDLPAKYGRYALVTGASAGIGAEFAD